MKLKVGKWYIDGHKRPVEIIGYDEDVCLFVSNGGSDYLENGRISNNSISILDLIKEVRVTIEEVEPTSEFSKIKRELVRFSCYGLQNMQQECINDWLNGISSEIERLQKLFEGKEND